MNNFYRRASPETRIWNSLKVLRLVKKHIEQKLAEDSLAELERLRKKHLLMTVECRLQKLEIRAEKRAARRAK